MPIKGHWLHEQKPLPHPTGATTLTCTNIHTQSTNQTAVKRTHLQQ